MTGHGVAEDDALPGEAVEFGRKYGVHVNLNFHRAPGYCVNPPKEPFDLWTDEKALDAAKVFIGRVPRQPADIPKPPPKAVERRELLLPNPIVKKIVMDKMSQTDAREAKAPPRFDVKAPEGAPNVVIVLIDDMGFGVPDSFGGPVAMPTLKKLAEQLKSANLNAEQQKKILDEVSKARPAASEYGKVADLLKQGAKQMQQGDKPNASQSLADAAKELAKLAQEDINTRWAALELMAKEHPATAAAQTTETK